MDSRQQQDGMNHSVAFFDRQFREQAAAGPVALNPFEQRVLPYLSGRVLDYGCGLGNLAFAAASRGCLVTALDASPAAIDHIQRRAAAEPLPVTSCLADLRDHVPADTYDAAVSIGLLMFFDCATARRQLATLCRAVRPGGIAAVNVLIEGTSFRAMFDPAEHCLFSRAKVIEAFAGWEVLETADEDFPAPGETLKRFVTLVARKPSA